MSDVHFDFAVLLTLLTLVTGIGWAIDKFMLAPRRRRAAKGGAEAAPNWIVEFCRSFFPVILAVLLLRSFIAEPFRIPSGSMIPTLLVGDFILVNKFAYGLRDPVFHIRFLGNGAPERGDVVVFRWPRDTKTDFIKRIVGVPGDHIEYRNKILYVNGEVAKQQPDGVYHVPEPTTQATTYRFIEHLGGVEHYIIVNPDEPPTDFSYTVPEGEYYAMGDNRDGSYDSRGWGTVPERNLVGHAFMIWMSWDSANNRLMFSRIGKRIH
jgi:signal peptidase I